MDRTYYPRFIQTKRWELRKPYEQRIDIHLVWMEFWNYMYQTRDEPAMARCAPNLIAKGHYEGQLPMNPSWAVNDVAETPT